MTLLYGVDGDVDVAVDDDDDDDDYDDDDFLYNTIFRQISQSRPRMAAKRPDAQHCENCKLCNS